MKRNLSLPTLLLIAMVAITPTPTLARDPVKNFRGNSGTYGFMIEGTRSCAEELLARATGEGEFCVEFDQRVDPLTPGNLEGRLRYAFRSSPYEADNANPVLVLWFQDVSKTVYIYPRSWMGRTGLTNTGDGWMGCALTRAAGPADRYTLGSRSGQVTVFQRGTAAAERFLNATRRRIATSQAPILAKSASELAELASTKVDDKPPAWFQAFQSFLPILSIANSLSVGKHVKSGKWPTGGMDHTIRWMAPYGYAMNDLGGMMFAKSWVNAHGLRADKNTTHYESVNITDRVMDFKLARREEAASGLGSHQWALKMWLGRAGNAPLANFTPAPSNGGGGKKLYGSGMATEISAATDTANPSMTSPEQTLMADIPSATQPNSGRYTTGAELMARIRAKRNNGGTMSAQDQSSLRHDVAETKRLVRRSRIARENNAPAPPPAGGRRQRKATAPTIVVEAEYVPTPVAEVPFPDAPAGGREIDPAGE